MTERAGGLVCRAVHTLGAFVLLALACGSAEALIVTTACTTSAGVGAVYEGTSALPHTEVPDCAVSDSASDRQTRRYVIYQHGHALDGWIPVRLGGTEAVYTSTSGGECRIVTKGADTFHYCYDDILSEFATSGFTVISSLRPDVDLSGLTLAQRVEALGNYLWTYAARADEIVDYLKAQGVPSQNIIVVGFSRGGVIAQIASYLAADSSLKFVSLSGCLTDISNSVFYLNFHDETYAYTIAADTNGDLQATRDASPSVAAYYYPQNLRGMALNLVRDDDVEGGACTSDTTDVSFDRPTTGFQYDDVVCSDTGSGVADCSGAIYPGHETFYQADPVWIDKVVQWIDEPGGAFQFSSGTSAVDEGAGTATLTVERTGFRTGGFTVDYVTSDGTAAAGSDYVATSGTLSFGPGVTSETVSIPVADDTSVEAGETVNVALSNPASGASLGSTSASVVTILNNDVEFRFNTPVYSVSEGGGTVSVTVTKLGGAPGTVSVDYATSDGTAVTGSDYVATTGTLTWAPGDPPSQTFTVTIVDDAAQETLQTVNLTLSNPTNASGSAALGTPATAVIRILDDDATVRFSAVAYTVSEADGTATVTVQRMGALSSTVSVDYSASDGTATAGADYSAATGTLTFAPGVTTATFSVSIIGDAVTEGDETVTLTLVNPGGATLVAPITATLTITNANTPAGTSVTVQPVDSTTGTTPVTLTFASVTHGGSTTLTTSSSGAPPPSGFQLGTPPTYYELGTTAAFSGTVTVCISYAGIAVGDESTLRLYHQEGGAWVDVTTSLDTVTDVICGSTTSFSAFALFERTALPVTIDIKPGAAPNTINLGANGTVAVAILSTPAFDARTLDPTTITLASAPVKLRGQGTPMASAQDVNGDGLLDLIVHVSTEALQLRDADTEAVLRGRTTSGRTVQGSDTVRVVP